uniref:EGF-like domain-containing protein n=1 Tax=Neogobius melanostomus TaxID=47308 RepID=A0A8C6V7T6_9GOBI
MGYKWWDTYLCLICFSDHFIFTLAFIEAVCLGHFSEFAFDLIWEQRPHVVKRFVRSCDKSFDNYCFNNGQCMFLVDLNENTCKCELGFRGSRCEQLLLVSKPMGETQKAFIIVCVILLIIGLTGALYFFCKWYMGWDSNLVGDLGFSDFVLFLCLAKS